MFERKHEYPAAFTVDEVDADEADRLATQWVLSRWKDVGGEILFYMPTARQRMGHPILNAFAARRDVVTATWRTFNNAAWSGGPVLAAWPSSKALSELSDSGRVNALCALTWNAQEVRPWALAVGAEPLGGQADVWTAELDDPVLKAAMETMKLLVNQNNTLTGGHEKAVVIEALLILRRRGHVLDENDLYAWAVSQGWRARRAEELREWVKKINDGTTPRIKRGVLRADVYEKWANFARQ